MIPPPRNILVSFYYYPKYDLDRFKACTIVGDSGAYSANTQGAEITPEQLTAWAKQWEHRLAWCASLDVVGDHEGTKRNWNDMCETGIPFVPTIHFGTPYTEMDYYAERGVDFMGLGGVAGGSYSPATVFRWLVGAFQYARDNHPQMRFHGWGMTQSAWLRLPFFTVDSSGWGASYRYGRMALRHPKTGKVFNVQLDGRSTYTPEIAQLLADHYGVTPSRIAKSGPENRLLMVQLSALSASVQEQQWRHLHRRSKITAPKWGRLGGWNYGTPPPYQHLSLSKGQHEEEAIIELNGPHQHLAEGHPEHLEVIEAMNEGRELWREKADSRKDKA